MATSGGERGMSDDASLGRMAVECFLVMLMMMMLMSVHAAC